MTWNPTTSHWPSHLIWLRTTHSADCWQRSALHTQVKATITELTRVSETIRKPSLTKPKTTLRNKKNKIRQKTPFNMADGILSPCNVARGLGWHASEFPKTSAILEFCFWFRFRPYHRSRPVILHQSAKFYPNRTTLGTKICVMSIFKMADLRHLEF